VAVRVAAAVGVRLAARVAEAVLVLAGASVGTLEAVGVAVGGRVAEAVAEGDGAWVLVAGTGVGDASGVLITPGRGVTVGTGVSSDSATAVARTAAGVAPGSAPASTSFTSPPLTGASGLLRGSAL
jgi:hypothetical protein